MAHDGVRQTGSGFGSEVQFDVTAAASLPQAGDWRKEAKAGAWVG